MLVRTKVELGNANWYIESNIKTMELMREFTQIAVKNNRISEGESIYEA